MVKIKRNGSAVPKDIDGHRLIPLSKAEDGWPRMQETVLPNTYYRINEATGQLSCMVTVMPDGLRLAWGSCGKCHDHVRLCKCKSGIYHSSSVGYIRATYDVAYPTERVADYSRYFDPFGRKAGKVYDRSEVTIYARPIASTSTPTSPRTEARKAAQKAKRDQRDGVTGLTAAQIENIDMAAVNAEAAKQAADMTKQVRRIIRRKKA